jgi:hypothetical protein
MPLCVGSRCWTTTNAMPVSVGMCSRNWVSASRPPAEAPTPTIGQANSKTWAAGGRVDRRFCGPGAVDFFKMRVKPSRDGHRIRLRRDETAQRLRCRACRQHTPGFQTSRACSVGILRIGRRPNCRHHGFNDLPASKPSALRDENHRKSFINFNSQPDEWPPQSPAKDSLQSRTMSANYTAPVKKHRPPARSGMPNSSEISRHPRALV